MSYADIVSTIAIVLSAINLVIYLLHYRKTTVPAINHELDPLPPYLTPDLMTTIIVRNDGTARARINKIVLDFSWIKDSQIILYDKESKDKSRTYLNPNEEWTFEKRLPEPPGNTTGTIKITTTFDRRSSKEDTTTVEGRSGLLLV